jgi:uncharacterized protein YehS (DUF1456 family)
MENGLTADASPVKEFFIEVITRDVEIIQTIPEFIDNSIDGALRERGDDEDLSDYRVRIDVNPDKIRISDNCGGIPLEVARYYAFRFGRPEDGEERLPSTIGEFGVGMKRSLFKLGNHFVVESKTNDNHFIIEVDVPQWRDDEGPWDFPITQVDGDDDRAELEYEVGTRIEVTELHDGVSDRFGRETFESRLIERLVSYNQQYLKQKFEVILNNTNLTYRGVNLLTPDELDPAYEHFTFEGEEDEVEVDIIAGLGDRSNQEAGWYVFCNGRLVLEGDQSSATGWGADMDETIPKFHTQFNRFRGLVYFESDNPGKLPWNTTKTGINQDSAVYRKARQRMVSIARPVITFLNEVATQRRETEEGETPSLEKEVEKAESKDSSEIERGENRAFKPPTTEEDDEEDDPVLKNISYQVPEERLDRVMREIGASTYKEAGEKTFEYFWKMEGLGD